MRKYLYLIALFISVQFLMACEGDDTVLPTNKYPSEITAFVNKHFSGSQITRIERDRDDFRTEYEVYLNTGFKLEFNGKYKVTDIKSKNKMTKLPDSVIPAKILSYVTKNYPSNFIVHWDLDSRKQSVELDNDYDLDFDLNGNFIRVDRD